jgi:hemerythrin-like domain-containing protein
MNDPLRILKADHREVEKLLKQLAETDEGDERRQLAQEIDEKLRHHMEIEERIVYPPVSDEVGEEDREEADIEHDLARQGLETMMSMLDKPGFGASVQMLLAGIKHHVEEEESELLPELRDAIGRDEWEAMGDALAEAKEAAGMPVPASGGRRSDKRRSRPSGKTRTAESKARSSARGKQSSAKKSAPKKSAAKKSAAKKSTATSSSSRSKAASGSKRGGARRGTR